MIEWPDALLVKATNAARSRTEPIVNEVKGPLSPQWKKVPARGSRPQPSPQAISVTTSSVSGSSH